MACGWSLQRSTQQELLTNIFIINISDKTKELRFVTNIDTLIYLQSKCSISFYFPHDLFVDIAWHFRYPAPDSVVGKRKFWNLISCSFTKYCWNYNFTCRAYDFLSKSMRFLFLAISSATLNEASRAASTMVILFTIRTAVFFSPSSIREKYITLFCDTLGCFVVRCRFRLQSKWPRC